METAQENWITAINKSAVARQVEKQKWDARDQMLTQMRDLIAQQRDKLISSMNISIYDDESALETTETGELKKKQKESRKDKKHKQQALDYFGRDQTEEFDWAEQEEGWNVMTDEDLVKHAEATNMVTNLAEALANQKIKLENPPGSGNFEEVDLFDDDDLANELYTPLVREGLLPETFVPDEYSRTAKMIKGSFDEYKGRLEEEGFSTLSVIADYGKFGMSMLSAGASMAGSVMTFKDAANLKPEDVQWSKFAVFQKGSDDTDWIKKLGEKDASQLIDVIGKGVDFMKDIAVEGYEDISSKIAAKYEDKNKVMEPQDRRALMSVRISDSMVSAISLTISEKFSRWEFAVSASSVYRSGVQSKEILTLLQSEKTELDDKDGSAIVTALAAGFAQVLAFCPKAAESAAKKATQSISSTFSNADAGAIADKLNQDDYQGAMNVVAGAAAAALDEVLKDDDFCNMLTNNKGEILKNMGNKVAEDFTNRLAEVERQQQEEWEKCKRDPKANISLIEKKIKEIENRRAALKWAKGLASLGISVASKFFAPLAIAGSAISLAENLTECVIRVRDAVNFIDSQVDMSRDASAYTAPIQNFIHNAEVQAIHFEIKATCDLINMIGAIVETAGYASGPGAAIGVAVGKTMQATASATSALEGVMYEIAKKVEARLGWNQYKLALLKPENRKLALIAMKKNPTLAKYSVAWGAIIEKDVLVADFITKTGLTVESLEDPKASVGVVVQYLEARMPEDNTIVGMEAVAKDWLPPPALTVECWSAAIRRGQDKGKLEIAGTEGDIKEVELAMVAIGLAWPPLEKLKKGQQPSDDQVTAAVDALRKATGALTRYKPLRMVKGKPIAHAEMKDFLGTLRGLAERRIEWIEGRGWEKL